jgi:hypothetical protein
VEVLGGLHESKDEKDAKDDASFGDYGRMIADHRTFRLLPPHVICTDDASSGTCHTSSTALPADDTQAISGRSAALQILAHVSRLCAAFTAQAAKQAMSDVSPQLPVLSEPLCVDVRGSSISTLADILKVTSAACYDSSVCPDSDFSASVSMLLSTLRILKVSAMSFFPPHQLWRGVLRCNRWREYSR